MTPLRMIDWFFLVTAPIVMVVLLMCLPRLEHWWKLRYSRDPHFVEARKNRRRLMNKVCKEYLAERIIYAGPVTNSSDSSGTGQPQGGRSN